MTDSALAALLRQLDLAFDHTSWHGPNLRGGLRRVTATEAGWRPAPNRHSIAEQIVHAAYWKYAVRHRLVGDKRGSFAFKGSNWFSRPDAPSAAAWAQDVALLVAGWVALVEYLRRRYPATGESGPGTPAATPEAAGQTA